MTKIHRDQCEKKVIADSRHEPAVLMIGIAEILRARPYRKKEFGTLW
jgi:hypothetical protein